MLTEDTSSLTSQHSNDTLTNAYSTLSNTSFASSAHPFNAFTNSEQPPQDTTFSSPLTSLEVKASSVDPLQTVASNIWIHVVNRDAKALQELLSEYRVPLKQRSPTDTDSLPIRPLPLPWNTRVENFPEQFNAKKQMMGANMYWHKSTADRYAMPKGSTPLHVAVHRRSTSCVQLLLAQCVDTSLWDVNGKTALSVARDLSDRELVACFRRDHLLKQQVLQEKLALLTSLRQGETRESRLAQDVTELRTELSNSSKRLLAYQQHNTVLADKVKALVQRVKEGTRERAASIPADPSAAQWAQERDELLDRLEDAELAGQDLKIALAEAEEDKSRAEHKLRKELDDKQVFYGETGPWKRQEQELITLKQKLLDAHVETHRLEQLVMKERYLRESLNMGQARISFPLLPALENSHHSGPSQTHSRQMSQSSVLSSRSSLDRSTRDQRDSYDLVASQSGELRDSLLKSRSRSIVKNRPPDNVCCVML